MNIPNKRKTKVLNKQTFQAFPLINTKSLVIMLILGPVASLTGFTANLIDLGQNVRPQDINNLGTVVGAIDTNQYPTVAFRWTASTGFETLNGTISNAVNDNEEIAGNTLTGAFYFDGSTTQYIGDGYQGRSINSLGKIAGCEFKQNPFRPRPNGTNPAIYDPYFIGQQWSIWDIARFGSRGRRRGIYADLYCVHDINDMGYGVGKKSRSGLNGSSAFIVAPAFDSGTFLPIPNGGTANAINNFQYIVGTTGFNSRAAEYPHAFLYDYDANTFTNLGTLPSNGPNSAPGLTSSALDLNEFNQVVGNSWLETAFTSQINPAAYHAFIWENGQMTDLNDYIAPNNWVLTHATAISNNGLIVGYGLKNGVEHGCLLSLNPLQPTPTPTAIPNATPTPTPTPSLPSNNFPAIDNNANPLKTKGTVTETGTNYFAVNGIIIWFDNSATIKFKSGFGNTIDVGEKVKVKAHTNIDGSGTAIKIKVGG